MSDIREEMVLRGNMQLAPEVAPETPPSEVPVIDAESQEKNTSQDEGVIPPIPVEQGKTEEKAVAPTDSESKTKEERREEGSKVGKKIGKLHAAVIKSNERADKSAAELATVRKELQDLKKSNSETDLNDLNFDDRTKKNVENTINESRMEDKARALESDIQSARQESWNTQETNILEKYPNYKEMVTSLKIDLPKEVIDHIRIVGPELAYHVADNPELAKNLASKNPITAATALIRIEGIMENSRGESLAQTQRIPPITPHQLKLTPTPSNGARPPLGHPAQGSMSDFMTLKRKQGLLR